MGSDDPHVAQLLSRFGGGRVAQFALQEALASSTSRLDVGGGDGTGTAAGGGTFLEQDADAASIARSGASVTRRSPVVPLLAEVEYSQTSQQSGYCDDFEQATPPEDSWDASFPELSAHCVEPSPQRAECSTADGSPASGPAPAYLAAKPSPGGTVPTAPQVEGAAGKSDARAEQKDAEALLLCSMLNTGHGGLQHSSSPPAPRLRRELQQELSGAELFSPLAVVVSEHSFEEALQPFASSHGARSPAPGHSPGPSAGSPYAADSANQSGSEHKNAASAEEAPIDARRGRTSKPAARPLRRAATPLTTALGEGSHSSGTAHGVKGGNEHQQPKQSSRESWRFAQPMAEGRQGTIKQPVWSSDDIPQGRATIPSSHLPPELPPAGSMPKPRPKIAMQAPLLTMERIKLVPPKAPCPGKHPAAVAPPPSGGRGGVDEADSASTRRVGSMQCRLPVRHTGRGVEALPGVSRSLQRSSRVNEGVCISAEDALLPIPRPSMQKQPAAPAPAIETQGTPEEDDVACVQDRFTQRLDRLTQLVAQRMQRRQQQQDAMIQKVTGFQDTVRAQQLGGGAQPATSESLQEGQPRPVLEPEEWGPTVARVRGADRGAPSHAGADLARRPNNGPGSACSGAAEAWRQQEHVLKAGSPHRLRSVVIAPAAPVVEAEDSGLRAGTASEQPAQETATGAPAEGSLPAPVSSGTEDVRSASRPQEHGCQQPVSSDMLHAACELVHAEVQHAASMAANSPNRVDRLKTLMQVKGEQDIAIKYLSAQPRPFTANPLPLSSMEPRLAELQELAQQRRREVHDQRAELLRSQERPFHFHKRDREWQEVALTAASAPCDLGSLGLGSRPRPETPPAFNVRPVPVSTTEARYALLVAEMQLQNRTVKGRSMTPSGSVSPMQPATAGAQLARELPIRTASSLSCRPFFEADPSLYTSSGRSLDFPEANSTADLSAAGTAVILPASRSAEGGYLTSVLGGFKAAAESNPLWEADEPPTSAPSQIDESQAGRASGTSACTTAAEWLATRVGTAAQCCDEQGEQISVDEYAAGESGSTVAPAVGQEPPKAASIGEEDTAQPEGQPAGVGIPAGLQEDIHATDPLQQQPPGQGIALPGPEGCSPQRGALRSTGSLGFPGVGVTRSHQLRVRSVQESLASGRFATKDERASATKEDLQDMLLLCSSPKQRVGSASSPGLARGDLVLLASPRRGLATAGGHKAQPRSSEARIGACSDPGTVDQHCDSGGACSACALACTSEAGKEGVAAPVPPGDVGARQRPTHDCMGADSPFTRPRLPAGAAPAVGAAGWGVAIPENKGSAHNLHSSSVCMESSALGWKLGTEVGVAASPSLEQPSELGDVRRSSEKLQAAASIAGATGIEPRAPGLERGSLVGKDAEVYRDTPMPHVEARHRQAEQVAKAEVHKILMKRGLAVLNYVEGQQQK